MATAAAAAAAAAASRDQAAPTSHESAKEKNATRLHEHERLVVLSERVLEQKSEGGVAERHVRRLRRQRPDDVAERAERLVDVLRLGQLLLDHAAAADALGTGQVDEHEPPVRLHRRVAVHRLEVDEQDAVGAARLLVARRRRHGPVRTPHGEHLGHFRV